MLFKVVAGVCFSRVFDGTRLSIGIEGANGDIGKNTLWEIVSRARSSQSSFDLLATGTVPVHQFVLSLQGRLEKQAIQAEDKLKFEYQVLEKAKSWGPAQELIYLRETDISVVIDGEHTFVVIDQDLPSEIVIQYRQMSRATAESRAAFFDSHQLDVVISAIGIKHIDDLRSLTNQMTYPVPVLVTGPLEATSRASVAREKPQGLQEAPVDSTNAPGFGIITFSTFRVSDQTGTVIKQTTDLLNIPSDKASGAANRFGNALKALAENPNLSRFVSFNPQINTTRAVSGRRELSTVSSTPTFEVFEGKRTRKTGENTTVSAQFRIESYFDNQFAYAANAVTETALALATAYHDLPNDVQANLGLPVIVSIASLLGTTHLKTLLTEGHIEYSSSSCTSNSSLTRMLWSFAAVYVAIHPEINPTEVRSASIDTIRRWAATAFTLHHRNTHIDTTHASTHSDLGNPDAHATRKQTKLSGSETQVRQVWEEFVAAFCDPDVIQMAESVE